CLERLIVTDAAGKLDIDVVADLARDLLHQRTVAAAAERGVEVDEVDPFRALVSPVGSGGDRVAIVGFRSGLALGQPHRLAIGDVDRGQQSEPRRGIELSHGLLSLVKQVKVTGCGSNWTAGGCPLRPTSPDGIGWLSTARSPPLPGSVRRVQPTQDSAAETAGSRRGSIRGLHTSVRNRNARVRARRTTRNPRLPQPEIGRAHV